MFTVRNARQYIKVAEAKRNRCSDFNACTSIREVLDLGKKPKEPKPKLEPDEADLQTMARLQTLAERGATEGERQAAKEKLENFASSFGYDEEEAEEKAKEAQEKEVEHDKIDQAIAGIKRKLMQQGADWIAEQLVWAMAQDQKIWETIAKRINQ